MAEVEQLAAFGAERAVRVVRPNNGLLAEWTGFYHHS
jgi:hypothetical protein